jgi:hypothetical protein
MPIGTPYAKKGSQRWLQVAVDRAPELLNGPLRTSLRLPAESEIAWLSPLRGDGFAEYRDEATFVRCNVDLSRRPLREFWPSRGPMWDGLARTARGDLLLIEAKAHISELVSPRSRAAEPARGRIAASVRAVQQAIAPRSVGLVDWTGTFYQYANRVAHLHFLRDKNAVRAHLVNIYFLHADDVFGPTERAGWEGALKVVECYLGLGRHRLGKYMHKLFIDVRTLKPLVAAG